MTKQEPLTIATAHHLPNPAIGLGLCGAKLEDVEPLTVVCEDGRAVAVRAEQ